MRLARLTQQLTLSGVVRPVALLTELRSATCSLPIRLLAIDWRSGLRQPLEAWPSPSPTSVKSRSRRREKRWRCMSVAVRYERWPPLASTTSARAPTPSSPSKSPACTWPAEACFVHCIHFGFLSPFWQFVRPFFCECPNVVVRVVWVVAGQWYFVGPSQREREAESGRSCGLRAGEEELGREGPTHRGLCHQQVRGLWWTMLPNTLVRLRSWAVR